MINIYWNSLISRICQEASHLLRNKKSNGVAILTIKVLIKDEKPLHWIVEGKAIEPGKTADQILDLMSD